jgi:hypothetical protein
MTPRPDPHPCASSTRRTLGTSFADRAGRGRAAPRTRTACRCNHRPAPRFPGRRVPLPVGQRTASPHRGHGAHAVHLRPSHLDRAPLPGPAGPRVHRLSWDPPLGIRTSSLFILSRSPSAIVAVSNASCHEGPQSGVRCQAERDASVRLRTNTGVAHFACLVPDRLPHGDRSTERRHRHIHTSANPLASLSQRRAADSDLRTHRIRAARDSRAGRWSKADRGESKGDALFAAEDY